MFSVSLCCLVAALVTQAPAQETPVETAAVARLKKNGASFHLWSTSCILLEKEPTEEDKVGYFVNLGGWTGPLKDLRDLNKLRNVRELAFTSDETTDDWCLQIDPPPNLEHLFLYGRHVTPKALEHFGKLPKLEALGICSSRFINEDLQIIERFEKLRIVNLLENLKITDDCLISVGKLKHLEVLLLDLSGVKGSGLHHLQKLKKLRRLSLIALGFPPEKAAQLTDLAALTSLENLNVSLSRMSEDDMKAIGKLKNLKKLDLHYCSGISKTFSYLTDLINLEELNLGDTKVPDAIGPVLAKMARLRYLNVSETKVSDNILPYLLELPRLNCVATGPAFSDKAREVLDAKLKKAKP